MMFEIEILCVCLRASVCMGVCVYLCVYVCVCS